MQFHFGNPDGYWQLYIAIGKKARCWSFKKGYEIGDNPYWAGRRRD